MTQREIVCNLCRERVTRVLFHWGSGTVMKCDGCGLVFRRAAAVVDPKQFLSHVDISGDKSMGTTHRLDACYDEQDSRVVMWRSFLNEMASSGAGQSKRVLDIGCAKGVFLDVARKHGWEPMGIEPAQDYSTYAREVFGLPVFTGTLEEARLPAGSFDVATMWDVIEHLQDPAGTVAETFRVLEPGGVLAILTPNHDSLLCAVGRRLYDLSLHRFPLERYLYAGVHFYFFTPETLTRLLERCGFQVVRLWGESLHAERCLVTNDVIRLAASLIDLVARPLHRQYRLAVVARKPMD